MTSAISCPLWSSVYKYQRVECAFTSPVRIECGMFVIQMFHLGNVYLNKRLCLSARSDKSPRCTGTGMPLCKTFIQVDSAVVLCQVLSVLPFTAADDSCREVSRSYRDKEAFSLQASLCWYLAI